jgi:putative flippase GtrA
VSAIKEKGVTLMKTQFISNIIIKINEIPLIKKILGENSVEQFTKYLIVGFSSFIIDVSLLFVFKKIINWLNPTSDNHFIIILANTLSVTIVFWFNFLMNRNWTFKSNSGLLKQILLYTPLFVFNIFAQDSIIYFLINKIELSLLFSKVIAVGVVLCWNLFIYKKVIFK